MEAEIHLGTPLQPDGLMRAVIPCFGSSISTGDSFLSCLPTDTSKAAKILHWQGGKQVQRIAYLTTVGKLVRCLPCGRISRVVKTALKDWEELRPVRIRIGRQKATQVDFNRLIGTFRLAVEARYCSQSNLVGLF